MVDDARSGESDAAGVEVRDLRGEVLVGEASGGGNAVGWPRVDTIFKTSVAMTLQIWRNAIGRSCEEGGRMRHGVVVMMSQSPATVGGAGGSVPGFAGVLVG